MAAPSMQNPAGVPCGHRGGLNPTPHLSLWALGWAWSCQCTCPAPARNEGGVKAWQGLPSQANTGWGLALPFPFPAAENREKSGRGCCTSARQTLPEVLCGQERGFNLFPTLCLSLPALASICSCPLLLEQWAEKSLVGAVLHLPGRPQQKSHEGT